MLSDGGLFLDPDFAHPYREFHCYTLKPELGEGHFWVYFYEDMFEISIRRFLFHEDFLMECPEPDFFSITYYRSVSGEEFHPYAQLSPNSLEGKIGQKDRMYQAIFHKNIPLKSISITIIPQFYDEYLARKFPGESISPADAFRRMESGTDFPELIDILKQIETYRGSGITAKMFYEGKILEAVSLIMERARENQERKRGLHLSMEDQENLNAVAAYLDDHYAFFVPMEHLCRISFMGQTKLKAAFKEYFGCTIHDYVVKKRVVHAQHLLIGTDFSIREIANAVGYDRSESFSRQFRKITGMLPKDYRKTIVKQRGKS